MNNVNQEVKQEERKDQVQNEPINTTQAQQEPVEDKNWAAVREQRKAERKAREEAERRATDKAAEAEALKAALEAITNKPSPQHQSNQYHGEEESEDERIRKRVEEIIKERESNFYKEQEQKERVEYPHRLRQTHPDFDKICDAENLDYLEYHHPEIVEPFKHMPDGFKKWDSLYKVAKKLLPNPDIKQDQKRMEQNLKKPGSISSTGTTQGVGIAPPARLSESQRASNWERMQRTLKGLS